MLLNVKKRLGLVRILGNYQTNRRLVQQPCPGPCRSQTRISAEAFYVNDSFPDLCTEHMLLPFSVLVQNADDVEERDEHKRPVSEKKRAKSEYEDRQK